MKRIAEQNLDAYFIQRARHQTLHRAVSTTRHKDRRLHHTVIQLELTAPGFAVGVGDLEFEGHQTFGLF